MIRFQVNDMTCGHCVSAVTKAVNTVDESASVEIDLRQRLVLIEPGHADATRLRDAIREAGYDAVEPE